MFKMSTPVSGGAPPAAADDDNNVLSLRERLRQANAKIDELMKAYGAALQQSGSKDADVQRSYAQKCACAARRRRDCGMLRLAGRAFFLLARCWRGHSFLRHTYTRLRFPASCLNPPFLPLSSSRSLSIPSSRPPTRRQGRGPKGKRGGCAADGGACRAGEGRRRGEGGGGGGGGACAARGAGGAARRAARGARRRICVASR